MPEDYPTAFSTPPVDPSAQAPMPNQSQKKPVKAAVILLTAALLFSLSAFGYTLWRYQMLKSESQIATQPPISTSTAVQDKPTAEKAETEIKRMAEDKNKYIYQMGNFELKIDRDYVYLDSLVSGTNKVSQSQAAPAEEAGYCSILVGGVQGLWLEQKYPDLERESADGNTLITFEYWNPNQLVFLNEQAETEIKESLQDFIDIFSYTDSGQLLEKVISSKRYELLSPWDGTGVGGCGGGFSYPILIQKINSQEYDGVYFAEDFYGNNPLSNAPSKNLIINKAQDWLLVKSRLRREEEEKFYEQIEKVNCPSLNSEEGLRCREQQWRENFRDDNANQQWVEKILGFVTYTGNN